MRQKKYSELKDTLINKDKISSISEMQTKYETEKKEQEIELLAEKNKTSLAERNALIAGSLGLILGRFVLLYAYYQRRKNALKVNWWEACPIQQDNGDFAQACRSKSSPIRGVYILSLPSQ